MTRSSKGSALVIVLVVVAVGALGVAVTPKGSGAKWYAPTTWFSRKPANAADKAKAAAVVANAVVDEKTAAVVHAATIEADKTVKGAAQLPASPAAAVVQRTAANTFGLLNQVSPLTAVESQDNTAVLAGLLASEVELRVKAEARQAEIEKKLALTSTELTKAQEAAVKTDAVLAEKQAELRTAFDKENSLANELRASSARHWIFGVVIVILMLALLYAKVALGGVGRALHAVDDSTFAKVAGEINTELGAVGQWAIRTGRLAAAKIEAHSEAEKRTATPAAPTPPSAVG